jgi:DNA-binding PadR family transcriptional regulator
MPLQHAVLALLGDGPAHGYQIRAAFEEAVGPQWGGLNIGHVYQILDRLARDGLVASTLVPQSSRPDRRVYQLTDSGRAELESWLAEPAERTGGYRDDLVLKLMAAARGSEQALLGVLSRQRHHELARLKGLNALAQEHRDEPLVALLLDAAILHTRSDLQLLDRAEERAASLVHHASGTTRAALQGADRPDDSTVFPQSTADEVVRRSPSA